MAWRAVRIWATGENELSTLSEVLTLLDDVLALDGRAAGFSADTPLLGNVPELDSMAVISVIHAIEDHFETVIADDEIDGSTFATIGTLVDFVEDLKRRAA
jgi:acyl carrier protein